MLDAYLLFCIVTGVTQFVYYFIAGSFQYNAFLGGFISSVGAFVLVGNESLHLMIISNKFFSQCPLEAVSL